jgi:UDP-N-acetylglucosamine:LPS N-acetylglucosamine transferase
VKVAFVCSSGGHLIQLYRLERWWRKHERVWVTFDTPDATSLLENERVHWAYHPTTRNVANLLRNMWLAWRVLARERPDVAVSNGAGVAFPFFLAARALRIATVYVEVYDRLDSPTLTGRLCHPLSDLFLLQWEEQLQFYRRGRLVGPIF